MDVSLYPGMGYDDTSATFPLRDFSGKMTGYTRYRPSGTKDKNNDPKEGRYYTYLPKGGTMGVFGLESLEKSGPIFLVGGLFKAATLHRLGFASLHVSNVPPRALRSQLALLRRPFFAFGDNDAEGAQFVRRWGGVQTRLDVDELSDSEVLKIVLDFMPKVSYNRA